MDAIYKSVSLLSGFLGFYLTVTSSLGLSYYLSYQWLNWSNITAFQFGGEFSCDQPFFAPLFRNLGVVLLFVYQHSFMASRWWKSLIKNLGCSHLERSIYVIVTSVTLNFMLNHFEASPFLTIWNFPFMTSFIWSKVLGVTHVVLWAIIFLSALGMEFFEFIGLRQIFDYCWPPAMSRDEPIEKQKADSHMRHSGFVCFVLILWICPVMTVERFLVSIVFTLYTLFGNRVTNYDYIYITEH